MAGRGSETTVSGKMCAIVGRLGWSSISVRSVCNAIQHRGPDSGTTVREFGSFAAASARLAITAPLFGSQPHVYVHGDRRLCVQFNGEIYNWMALAAAYNISAASEVEMIGALYAMLGMESFNLFMGMYAIALFEDCGRSVSLILVRDPFGIKPLYYCFGHGCDIMLRTPQLHFILHLLTMP